MTIASAADGSRQCAGTGRGERRRDRHCVRHHRAVRTDGRAAVDRRRRNAPKQRSTQPLDEVGGCVFALGAAVVEVANTSPLGQLDLEELGRRPRRCEQGFANCRVDRAQLACAVG